MDKLYSGLEVHLKELWDTLPDKGGEALYVLGLFLSSLNSYHEEKRTEELDEIAEKMVKIFKNQNHSGGSSAVTQQMLLDLFGARSCTDDERRLIIGNKVEKE